MAFKLYLRVKEERKRAAKEKAVYSLSQAEIGETEEAVGYIEKKKQKYHYEMILYWPKKYWPNKPFEYQRLGFKAGPLLSEASLVAEGTAKILAACSSTLQQLKENKVRVEMIAVYKRNSFQNWSNEPYNKTDPATRKHLENVLAQIRESKNLKSHKSKPLTKKEIAKIMIVR